MAKQCPSCNKPVHDRYNICPFCRYDFGEGGDIDTEPSPPGRGAAAAAPDASAVLVRLALRPKAGAALVSLSSG
ncbi:MAG: hypothetical protein V3U74_02745 [Thermodesulfobacteriota bacterium]